MTTTQTTSPTPGIPPAHPAQAAATCILASGPITALDVWHVHRFRRFLTDRKTILDSYANQLADLQPDDPQALVLRAERRRVITALLQDYDTDQPPAHLTATEPAAEG